MKRWIRIKEAARLLHVSDRTVRRRFERGELQTRKWGARREVFLDVEDEPTLEERVEQLEKRVSKLEVGGDESRENKDV